MSDPDKWKCPECGGVTESAYGRCDDCVNKENQALPQLDSTVYVDQLFQWGTPGKYPNAQAERVGARNGHKWCHMWSADKSALVAMAKKIGMRESWMQDSRGFVHFDLVASKRAAAVKCGAVEIDMRDMAIKWKELRDGR